MGFTDLFIRRPVLATALNLVILLLGLRAYLGMTVREYPKMTNTVISVTTSYPGASPSTVQGFITTILEKAIASAPDIDYMTSTSSQGVSAVQVYMKLNSDPNAALTQVIAKVNQVRNQLPPESESPVVNETEGDATALMYLAFYSTSMSSQQIADYLNRVIQPKIQSVAGVGQAQILPAGSGNGNTFALRAWLNPEKMAALGITPSQVATALASNDFVSAVGRTKGKNVAITIRATTGLHSVAEFRHLVIADINGTQIHLGDVARVELGAEDYDQSVYFKGEPATFIGVTPTPTANALSVADGVHKVFGEIQKDFPPGLHAGIPYDGSVFIRASIHEVIATIAMTLGVVVLVIFLFLGSFRSLLIPAVAIPLSIVGTGLLMLALHFTLNLMTLLAIVLAIGLVVDDAIIVVENIHRHIEEGKSPLDAAIQSARELTLPIVVMSTTLVAVFAPIGFMGGLTGSLFSEFAFTLASSVLISMVVALTLSPVMGSRVLRHTPPQGLAHFLDQVFDRLRARYNRSLHGVLNYRPVVVVFSAVILVSIVFLFTSTRQELAPTEDQGILFVQGKGPPTATLHYLERYSKQILKIFGTFPEEHMTFLVNGIAPGGGAGNNSSFGGMLLKPWGDRSRSQMEIQPLLQAKLTHITGLQTVAFGRPAVPGSAGGLPIQFVVKASADYQQINQVSDHLIEAAMHSGLFMFLDKDLKYDSPELVLSINRNMAATLGITMSAIAQDLQPLLGGNYINRFSMAGQSYKVIPQVPDRFRANPELLKQYYIRTGSGTLVPLSTVASVHTVVQPDYLPQFQQLNSATVQGVMAPGITMGQALTYLKDTAAKLFPPGFEVDYASQSRQYTQQGGGALVSFALAIILVYLLLAAQFESFRDPLIVMTTVPMSICGALIFLSLGLATLNIYTEVGLITLIGLITKQGILIVQFARDLQRHEGLSKRDAVERASSVRLRPILMTTGAMVVGVMPLLLATGPGAVSRHDMGLVIATGLSIGALFSLYVVPTFYVYLARDHAKESLSAG
ncbi:MAG: multidrug efflux protein [Chromatiales bacterium 21-64-14]|nr:MAG: multidrug efflux protein [Chromatiales bacterium 21-64-14]HQU16259.1 efflux RND transporter permease subunit [Gammaproteobacteria bacterium]